jgi:O-antigen/teichoic acid export membrane protein
MGLPPEVPVADLDGEVTRRAVSGVRWVLLMNLATLPLSFFTNMVLGRVSPKTLGYFGAVNIFAQGFQTFFVLGGAYVFTRLVPALRREDRLRFLTSYTAIVLLLFVPTCVLMLLAAPWAVTALLDRFGVPSVPLALAFCVAVLLYGFTCHFLYAVLQAPRAVLTLKAVIIGFFIASLAGFTVLRASLASDPPDYLWHAALAIYGGSALIGLFFVWRTPEYRCRSGFRWLIPKGFWPVVLYTHAETVATFVYTCLASSFVLLWLDVDSLGYLYGANRYPAVLALVPVMLTSVIAPGLSTLEAAGLREDVHRKAATAIRSAYVLVVPACLAFMMFSRDLMAIFGARFVEHRSLLPIVVLSSLAGPVVYLGVGTAVALGAFGSYVLASLIYVASAFGLLAILVPPFGLIGAAWATVLGALVQQTAIIIVLRFRLGVRIPSRVHAAWVVGFAAAATAVWLDPGRLAAVGLFVGFLAVFALLGRVTIDEARSLALRLLRPS